MDIWVASAIAEIASCSGQLLSRCEGLEDRRLSQSENFLKEALGLDNLPPTDALGKSALSGGRELYKWVGLLNDMSCPGLTACMYLVLPFDFDQCVHVVLKLRDCVRTRSFVLAQCEGRAPFH